MSICFLAAVKECMVEKIGHKNAFHCEILLKIADEVAMDAAMRFMPAVCPAKFCDGQGMTILTRLYCTYLILRGHSTTFKKMTCLWLCATFG